MSWPFCLRGTKGEAATLFSLSPAAASFESWGTLSLQTPCTLPVSQGRLGKPPTLPSLASWVYPKLLWLLDRGDGCMCEFKCLSMYRCYVEFSLRLCLS